MNQNQTGEALFLGIATLVALVVMFNRRPWKPSTTAHGQAAWATEATLEARGMLGRHGLVLARTRSGKLIRLPTRVCHTLLIGGTGSGKGVSIIFPNLLTYYRGSLIVFDCKGDLFSTAMRRKKKGQRIIRLAPFSPEADRLNMLDTIPSNSPILVEAARALASALVVATGLENDMHWNEKATQTIAAVLVAVLLRFDGESRNLNTAAELVADPQLLQATAKILMEIGGIPARMGAQLGALFDPAQPGMLSKEGASVVSTAARHLAFLDSESVAHSVSASTFNIADLCKPGVTLFLQIPPDHQESMKGLLRCWVSTLVREISRIGCQGSGEVFFVLDEASALNGLSAIEEALVRGRSSGVRMLLVYQSDSQIQAAFKDKKTLLYDNTDAHIYLGASSYETAERISKMCGDFTQTVSSYNENQSYSYQSGMAGQGGGPQNSRGSSENWAIMGRNLIRPEEVLTLSTDFLICFVLYGTQTQGEIAQARGGAGQGPEQESKMTLAGLRQFAAERTKAAEQEMQHGHEKEHDRGGMEM